MKKAWLGLGGNIGDVTAAMAKALQMFDTKDDLSVRLVSPIYKTPPWGVEDQPWFLNCCAEIETSLSPEEVLEECQAAERVGKRERVQRWGPRTIDIDILVFEGVEQVEQRLVLPHPRMTERAFVLVPLTDIAPALLVDNVSIADHCAQVDRSGVELASDDENWWRKAGSTFVYSSKKLVFLAPVLFNVRPITGTSLLLARTEIVICILLRPLRLATIVPRNCLRLMPTTSRLERSLPETMSRPFPLAPSRNFPR